MDGQKQSRRTFLGTSGALAGGSWPCLAQSALPADAQRAFVQQGRADAVQPGTWTQQADYLEVVRRRIEEGERQGLFGDRDLGVGDFHVQARLRIGPSGATGAAFRIGDSYFGFNIPLLDLADETPRQVLVDREPGQYLGHPTTVLLEDGRTILTVYPKGHGRGAIVYKRSTDGGLTWGAPTVVTSHPAADLCEPGVIRSPDGLQLALHERPVHLRRAG